jgi:hypothetical protein
MRRNKTLKRNRQRRIRIVHVMVACGIGYLLGGWHTTALRSTALSASETVALRFPEIADTDAAASSALLSSVSTSNARKTADATQSTTPSADIALLSPDPMVPQAVPQAAPVARPQADQQTPVQIASTATVVSSPLPDTTAPARATPSPAPTRTAAAHPAGETKIAAAAVHRAIANRPGYMLNDAQIASIKERLNLTPDQQQMWPAVEAALRNIAYTRAQQTRGHGTSTDGTQTAAVDPTAVQGLKSAAVPLVMSFNSEQKEEVRNLVHVMGLDQLASEF